MIDYGNLIAELEREKTACEYSYGDAIPDSYERALNNAIAAIRVCRTCSEEAQRILSEEHEDNCENETYLCDICFRNGDCPEQGMDGQPRWMEEE